MRKVIVQMADRHNSSNKELMQIRQHFLDKIQQLGGLDSCRENVDLIRELEEAERQYDEVHESIVDRFLYNGTVHWRIEKYDETIETYKIIPLECGYEKIKKVSTE